MSQAKGRAIREQFPIFGHQTGPFHFLDNASTGQICAPALNALCRFEQQNRANVKRGIYRLADRATQDFEQARHRIARYLGVPDPNQVIMTSGTTMGLNIAASCLAPGLEPGDEILISSLEHHSNIVPWQLRAQQRGVQFRAIPVTNEGRLDLAALANTDTSRVRIIAVTHCSNVTGAITDMPTLKALADRSDALIVVDGAQMAAHGPLNVPALGCDFYAISSHKMFGPTGAGALWVTPEILAELPPYQGGGEMIRRVEIGQSTYADAPDRFEAGTPPIGPIIGMGAAADWLMAQDWQTLAAHGHELTADLIDRLSAIDGLTMLGPLDQQSRVGIAAFDIDGIHPHDLCQMLDEFGVCLRGGHHCAQPLMDRFDLAATSRASLAPYNDHDDIDALISGIHATMERLR